MAYNFIIVVADSQHCLHAPCSPYVDSRSQQLKPFVSSVLTCYKMISIFLCNIAFSFLFDMQSVNRRRTVKQISKHNVNYLSYARTFGGDYETLSTSSSRRDFFLFSLSPISPSTLINLSMSFSYIYIISIYIYIFIPSALQLPVVFFSPLAFSSSMSS